MYFTGENAIKLMKIMSESKEPKRAIENFKQGKSFVFY